MPATDCPSKEELYAYSLGALTPQQIEALSAHIESCSACGQRLALLEEPSDGLIDRLRSSAITVADVDDDELKRLIRIADDVPRLADTRPSDSSHASPSLQMPRDRRERQRPYRLLGRLGAGGMGVVYKMHHVPLDRTVAVKLLRHDRRWDPRDIARFEREIRAIGKLDHPNLVRATDAGKFHGRHYLVMENIEGIDLGQYLQAHGALPVPEACEVIRQAALGLQHAFENGIIHRDIKPSNLMISNAGIVKVLDLGLAVLKSDEPRRGDGAGTVQFMAPEQRSRQALIDSRVDIYGLGATLNALLGSPIRLSENSKGIDKSPLTSRTGTKIPSKLVVLIRSMMATVPADRPKAPAEVAFALEPYARAANLKSLLSPKLVSSSQHQRRYRTSMLGAAAVLLIAIPVLAWRPWKFFIADDRAIDSSTTAEIQPAEAPNLAVAPFLPGEAEQHQRRWAKWSEVPIFAENSIGMHLALIPPGQYIRGAPPDETLAAGEFAPVRGLHARQQQGLENEGPQHPVLLSKPFYLGVHEVTQQQFAKLMNENPSEFTTGSTQGELVRDIDPSSLPVEHVTWSEAVDFCLKLSTLPEERAAGRLYRLPTEAEWEFACRAGSETARWFGDLTDVLEPHAWYIDNSESRPHRVGQKAANPFGLHDMYGNVWEWCSDWQGRYPETATLLTDPTGQTHGERRILRGGSWRHHASYCRSAERLGMAPHDRNISVGFRVVCEVLAQRSK